MRIIIIAAAAAALSAAPAWAQDSGNQQSGQTGTAQTQAAAQQPDVASQETVRKSLTDAGFQEVTIMDTAFAVRAKTKEGQTVFMLINPPEGMDATGSTPAAGAAGGSTDQNQNQNQAQ